MSGRTAPFFLRSFFFLPCWSRVQSCAACYRAGSLPSRVGVRIRARGVDVALEVGMAPGIQVRAWVQSVRLATDRMRSSWTR